MLKDNIKRLRKQRRLSQDNLAQRVHVVRQTVSKWERGSSVPDADTLRALAEALDTTPNDLLGEHAPPMAASNSGSGAEPDAEMLALRAGLLEAQVAQKDAAATIYRRTVLIFAAICIAILVAAAIWAMNEPMNRFMQGVEHGFDLEGTYTRQANTESPVYASFGIVEDGNGLWQLADFNREEPINGRFDRTGDPNLYTLMDKQGEPVGWASLAYTGSDWGQVKGVIYVQYGEECYQLEKMEREVIHYANGEGFGELSGFALYNLRNDDGTWQDDIDHEDWIREWFDEE